MDDRPNVTIDEAQLLISEGATRGVRVKWRKGGPGRGAMGEGWTVLLQTKGGDWKPVRSQREPVRVWKDLGRLARQLREIGVGKFTVEQGG